MLGVETTDDTTAFEATEAWTRSGTVLDVTDRTTFTATIDEPRAVDGWFAGGLLTWESCANAGRPIEVKASKTQATGEIELFLPMGYAIVSGDTFAFIPAAKSASTAAASALPTS